ncbi:hypothetical protein T492DRAFT_912559 [Pavlovales sp. CCMP2436]|nr:hypothetical protein T492DRAFT_912559 [Pavlovales sp. CCMP2436]
MGLRTAVGFALIGMDVTIVKKRSAFSHVNILTMWSQTAEDLATFGAKLFYPAFTVCFEMRFEPCSVYADKGCLCGIQGLYVHNRGFGKSYSVSNRRDIGCRRDNIILILLYRRALNIK